MRVEFKKTGERRYGVIVWREHDANLEMNPAPGFDALLPHDLMHFLVEQEFDLRDAIFGQLDRGGTAGTFHQLNDDTKNAAANVRDAARAQRKSLKRGRKMLKDNTEDCMKSERATYICLYEWFSASSDESLRARARDMKPSVASALAQMPKTERETFNERKLAAVRARMDDLSARWSALKTGESITLEW